MATFPFTVRAIDSENAFSDRQFSINVRNTRVERYLIIDPTNAWTSNDLVNWTIRLGQGGTHCAYGNGMWMVIASTGVRTSADGINWTFTPTASLVVTRPNGDAATWTAPTSNYAQGIATSLSFAAGRFWFTSLIGSTAGGGGGHALYSSADGINWRFQPIPITSTGSWIQGGAATTFIANSKRTLVDVGNNTLVFNSNTIDSATPALNLIGYQSTDGGVTWTGLRRNDLPASAAQASGYLTRFNGVYYAFTTPPQGQGGTFTGTPINYAYSTDGSNWINSTLSVGNAGVAATFTNHPTVVCHYVNGQLIVLGSRGGGNTATAGHLQTSSVNGTSWTIDPNRIKSYHSSTPSTVPNASWSYRNGVLLGALSTTPGNDTTQTTTIIGPGVRYSVDGGLTWTASFPLNSGGTTNTTGYNDVAIMG